MKLKHDLPAADRFSGSVKDMGAAQLKQLADDIRALLIETVLRNGGHLASNLGVVELTIALFKAFDFPEDKIVWDVGHQSYVYKILSGRADQFTSLRRAGGLSGFPKRDESPYDMFDTGHSSTSISAALGIARARDILGEKYRVVAVTGDGALTGGLCYEALNDAGHSATDITVILNDNEMSISGNVGGISRHLSRIRSLPLYFSLRDDIHNSLEKISYVGKPLASFISKIKSLIKYTFIPGVLFEEMGFRYIGPVDGHNTIYLAKILDGVSKMRGPVLVHVLTKKGKGYAPAESDPQKYHSVSPAPASPASSPAPSPPASPPASSPSPDGISAAPRTVSEAAPALTVLAPLSASAPAPTLAFSNIFGREMTALAAADPSIVAISAAMTDGTGLGAFASKYPKRFFDVGIAEQHALTLAAGMSLYGLKPVAALYSTFLQRAYDQALHDICLQNAHVVIAIDRAGIVGEDGETHQGLYDMAFLRHMPSITIMAPAYDAELPAMLRFALYKLDGPVAIRYPKGAYSRETVMRKLARLGLRTEDDLSEPPAEIKLGRGELLAAGGDITIVSIGVMLDAALDAVGALAGLGYSADLISARFVKPFDAVLIANSVKKTGRLLVAEDGCAAGGFGGALAEYLHGHTYDARFCALPDSPVEQGARAGVMSAYGLDGAGILEKALEMLNGKNSNEHHLYKHYIG